MTTSSPPSPYAHDLPSTPSIDRSGSTARLFVDDAVYQVRGVELHNSTSSSPTAFAHGLEVAAQVHANTVLASVTWEMVEPSEGVHDFTAVAQMIEQARTAGIRLVLLWFGAWKNGQSSYAPSWVKRDLARFPRCVLEDGTISDTLTPFGDSELDSDAFVAFIRFLEKFDAAHRTVLMVQIENEIGLLGSSRDHSAHATTVFHAPIPGLLGVALQDRPGFDVNPGQSWADVQTDPFGRDEAFMAFGYASHVQKLATRARLHTALPFFVNAWLDSDITLDIPEFKVAGGQTPGTYPSGGPLPRVADVWQHIAPAIDLFTPDVYFGNIPAIYTAFSRMSGGLFIPEQRTGDEGVGAAFLAIGEYQAIGVSPFGVDSRTDDELAALTDGYGVLAAFHAHIAERSEPPIRTRGFHLTDEDPTLTVTFGDIQVELARNVGIGVDLDGARGYGIIAGLGQDTLVFAGRGFQALIDGTDPAVRVCIGQVTELDDPARDITGRVLNGDETAGGSRVLHPPRERVVSPFPIATGHTHTGVSTLTVYRRERAATPRTDG